MGRLHSQISESQSWVDKEKAQVDREILEAILSGKGDSLNPNSRNGVTIRGHLLCVYTQEETDPDCVLWQWHGLIGTYNPAEGSKLEYIQGHYYHQRYRYDELSEAIDAQMWEAMQSMEIPEDPQVRQ